MGTLAKREKLLFGQAWFGRAIEDAGQGVLQRLPCVIDQRVKHRHGQEGEQRCGGHPANDHVAETLEAHPQLARGSQRQRDHAKDGRQGGHDDRPEPVPGREQQRLGAPHAGAAKPVDVIDEHDAVVHHHADQQDAANEAHLVHACAGEVMSPHRTDRRQRDGEYDGERHQHALEQERDEHVDEHDRERHRDKAAGDLAVVECHLDFAERNALRQVDVAPGILDGPPG